MTFSILARDPSNGRFGVAVATCHLAVGSTVPHIRSGVGAVATQAHTNPYLGICGLERMEQNRDAETVLASLLRDDPQMEHRQLHLIDACGRTAGWTGSECGPYASHRCHPDLAVAGNFLAGEAVLLAMEEAFLLSDPSWKLGRRLLSALRAGEEAGGDLRSPHATSAALQVSGEAAFPLLDLRVDFEERAVDSLMELYERSQQLWVQQWRDSFAELPNPAGTALNRTVTPLVGDDPLGGLTDRAGRNADYVTPPIGYGSIGGAIRRRMTGSIEIPTSSTTPQVKLHYWTNGGAQSVVVPLDEEVQRHRLLLSNGAVLLKRELIAA